MLYYVILCYIMLYYVILCYIMLYYVILYYIIYTHTLNFYIHIPFSLGCPFSNFLAEELPVVGIGPESGHLPGLEGRLIVVVGLLLKPQNIAICSSENENMFCRLQSTKPDRCVI